MIPQRVTAFLDQCGIHYVVHPHRPSRSSAETARAAHVPPHRLAKSVILEDAAGPVMVVLPADQMVMLREAAVLLDRHAIHLADEACIAGLFVDCARGAVPPIGMAWGLPTLVDDELVRGNADLFFESGDHECLLRVPADDFRRLMQDARHGRVGKTPVTAH